MKTKSTLCFKIASDFSQTPGPRFIVEGDYSGEQFREECLRQLMTCAIEENKNVQIDLDGAAGYATSFLEEAFGGLIRENGFRLADIKKYLKLISKEEPYLIDDIRLYMEDAAK